MTVGRRIRTWRIADGLTQQELAARIGVTVRTVSAWETGTRHPGPKSRTLLGRTFGQPTAYFKEGK